jgi:hypothetical protein
MTIYLSQVISPRPMSHLTRANEGAERDLPGMLRQFHVTAETVTIAGVRAYRVSIDDRMPPDYPFPAALDGRVWFLRLFLSWCIKDFSSSEI